MAPKQTSKTQTGSKNTSKQSAPARSTRSTSRAPDPTLPTPAPSTRATKSRSATAPLPPPAPPSRKRKATEDIPVPSIETSERNNPIPNKRSTKRSKKTPPTAPAVPRCGARSAGKAPPSSTDPLWGGESKHIEYVGKRHPPTAPAMDAALAASREAAFVKLLTYEYSKRRPRGKSTLFAFLRRRVPPAPAPAPAPARWEYIAAPPVEGDTGAVDASNILTGGRRTRNAAAGTARPARKRRAVKAEDASSLPAAAGPSKRVRREQSAAVPAEEAEEVEEEISVPPIVGRTPSPYPGEEREAFLGYGGGGGDGLGDPSGVTTIWWEGVEYRDFRRDDPVTGVEERYWIRVRRSRGE